MYLILHMNSMGTRTRTLTAITMMLITMTTRMRISTITSMTMLTIPTCLPGRMVRLSPGAAYWRLGFQAGSYPDHPRW